MKIRETMAAAVLWIVVTLLAVDMLSALVASCYAEAHPSEQRQAQHSYKETAEERGGIVTWFVLALPEAKAEAFTAGATIFVAMFTVVLAVATIRLWEATNRLASETSASVALGNREFTSTHRPKLILREAFSLRPNNTDHIVITYRITNIGGTRAWIVQSQFDLEIFMPGHVTMMMTPRSDGRQMEGLTGAIAPGESIERQFRSPGHIWDQNHRTRFGATDMRGLHFVGHFVYIDEPGSNVRRQTAFRRLYDHDNQRFRRIWTEENEHEYAD